MLKKDSLTSRLVVPIAEKQENKRDVKEISEEAIIKVERG